MITLFLLHPLKQIPVQVWTFENEPVIRIGRSTDNHVILYSAVVSRHHVELRHVGSSWEIVNIGTNGTYLDGKRITQMPLLDGAIIRLARSGPNIQIRLGEGALQSFPEALTHDQTVSQPRADLPFSDTEITSRRKPGDDALLNSDNSDLTMETTDRSAGIIPVPPHLLLQDDVTPAAALEAQTPQVEPPQSWSAAETAGVVLTPSGASCPHTRAGEMFCLDCGQPLHSLDTLGGYQLVKKLGQGPVGVTYLAWKEGQSVVLKTLNPSWMGQPKAWSVLEFEADVMRQLQHAKLPHFIDFVAAGPQPYLVMEWMRGQNLAEKIVADGPVSVNQAIAWVLQVCDILEYLHGFTPPIIHQGLKPSSLICQTPPEGDTEISVVDFGALKLAVLSQELPASDRGFAAPEQPTIHLTGATDLYALGPILAYLVTGHNPVSFYGDWDLGYRFYANLVPGLDPDLIQILETLTYPDPERRHSSVSKVKDELHRVQQKISVR